MMAVTSMRAHLRLGCIKYSNVPAQGPPRLSGELYRTCMKPYPSNIL